MRELTPQEQSIRSGYGKWLRNPVWRRTAGKTHFLLFHTALRASWRKLRLRPEEQLLEIGCGPGTVLCFLTQQVGFQHPPRGLDITPEMVGKAQETIAESGLQGRVVIEEGSALAMPFPDNSFDVVLSSHMLHNVSDENLPALLREVHRVLRPGGRFLAWAFGHDWQWWSNLSKTMMEQIMRPPSEVVINTWFRNYQTLSGFLSAAGFSESERLVMRPWLFTPTPRVGVRARKPAITGISDRVGR